MYVDARADMTAAVGRAQRADDVLDMQRAARRGGIAPLLRWLAVRTGAAFLLMTPTGIVVYPPQSPMGDAEHDLAQRGVREFTTRRLGAVTIDQKELTCIVLPLDGPRGVHGPLLAAVVRQPQLPELPLLLADATSILSLSWQAEDARQQQRRLRLADARTREAVLHLLMNGQVTVARQVAGALRPELPDTLRVYVIEGPHALRATVADELAGAAEGAWIVPCPVYTNHMLVIAPAGREAHSDGAPPWAWPPSVTDTCWVGVSDAVRLRETATGYAQAFHALAAARQRTERHSSFAGHPDLALTIGPAAVVWAEAFLSPLRAHHTKRSQDPDSTELLATAASWLSFSSRATAHLKIHRNTLAGRLKCIQELLGLNLNRLADQAALALALRTIATGLPPEHDTTGTGRATPALDELLRLPSVVAWAQRQFRPVQMPDVPPCIVQTLTTWLRLDARIGPTAAVLSISASAVRKRLTRSEALLECSLLRSPSAVHDQWLAQRALELAEKSAVLNSTSGMFG